MADTVNSVAIEQGPTMSQRDPSQEYNQLRPRSLRSSGMELDESCGEITQATAGEGLDKALRMIGSKDQEAPARATGQPASESVSVPPLTSSEGEALATKSGAFVDWKATKIAGR